MDCPGIARLPEIESGALPQTQSQSSSADQGQPVAALTPAEKVIAQQLAAVETAFVQKNCVQIKSNQARIEPLRAGGASLPLMVRLAFAWCDAESNPQHHPTNERALQLLALAQKELSPLVNAAYLEELKAERYQKAGKTDLLLNSKKRVRELLREQEKKAMTVDAEIFSLSTGVTQLNAQQKATLNGILASWPNPELLIVNLNSTDRLIADVQNAGARDLLLQIRSALLTRIEEQFAMDSSFVEARLREGNGETAKIHAEKMKSKYPVEAYLKRIDSLLQPSHPGGGSSPSSAAAGGVRLGSEVSGMAPGAALGVPTPDTEYDKAKLLLDSGKPEETVLFIDSSPLLQQYDKAQKLRREAAEIAVRKGRIQVRNIYNRANLITDRPKKLEALKEAKKVLEELLSKYPDAQGRSGIERNLKTIQLDIEGLEK